MRLSCGLLLILIMSAWAPDCPAQMLPANNENTSLGEIARQDRERRKSLTADQKAVRTLIDTERRGEASADYRVRIKEILERQDFDQLVRKGRPPGSAGEAVEV